MFNVRTEMPSGMRSRGYERDDEEKALTVFGLVVSQVRSWKGFVCDVILSENSQEMSRETIRNANR